MRKWTDNSRRKIEDCLNLFVEALYEEALKRKEIRKARKIEDKQMKAEFKKREEQARQRQIELEKINKLEKMALEWNKRQMISAFLADVEKKDAERLSSDKEFREWFEWARSYANSK